MKYVISKSVKDKIDARSLIDYAKHWKKQMLRLGPPALPQVSRGVVLNLEMTNHTHLKVQVDAEWKNGKLIRLHIGQPKKPRHGEN